MYYKFHVLFNYFKNFIIFVEAGLCKNIFSVRTLDYIDSFGTYRKIRVIVTQSLILLCVIFISASSHIDLHYSIRQYYSHFERFIRLLRNDFYYSFNYKQLVAIYI